MPMAGGVLFAACAALLFGISTPIIKRAGGDVGPFTTALLLYGGAVLASLPRARGSGPHEAPVRRQHAGRIAAVALLGGVVAPVCLAWGLHRTSATSASLLLNFEAVFTVLLGVRLYGESLGPRAVAALVFMVMGGAVLVALGERDAGVGWGAVAAVLAALAWAADSALTRPLADLDPVQVVRWKGGAPALVCLPLAITLGEPLPRWDRALILLGCGVLGYGVSMRFYLLAQRRIGAGRTGSVFALAPFIGAAVAWFGGERTGSTSTLAGAVLFGVGVYLQATEAHEHEHTHEAVTHEHRHRHDDGHHDHVHEQGSEGEHSHLHTHDARTHAHPHGPDTHHRHGHA